MHLLAGVFPDNNLWPARTYNCKAIAENRLEDGGSPIQLDLLVGQIKVKLA